MTTAPDRIAVIAMQLARTDPRALSQAWYDALHLAQPAAPAAAPAPRVRSSPSARPRRDARQQSDARTAPKTPAVPHRRLAGAAPQTIARDADVTVHRVARTIACALHAPRRYAQTIALGTARVRLLVRNDAGVTRVVALCAPADREHVARALAGVRVALAGAGVTLAA